MNLVQRIKRHARLTGLAMGQGQRRTPPFMIVFINSICNLTCEHCFYWRSLNSRDDLSYDEFKSLSEELGDFENLNLSGGEPFIHGQFADICSLFLDNNHVRQIYVPTSGYFTNRTQKQLRDLLPNAQLETFACELSLDGTEGYHNRFRGDDASFRRAMDTYDMLAELQREYPKLRIHSISTATHENLEEIDALTHYLYERCPAMDHHNLAIIRGDRKNESLEGPNLERYFDLYQTIARLWADREKKRTGAIVEPMLQWAKKKTIQQQTQYVPCTAGRLSGVVYANGDVSVCENHPPLGNLREQSFFQIWDSPEAEELRGRIRDKECYCTNEVFLWPSIVFQPLQLTKALIGTSRESGLVAIGRTHSSST